MEKILKGKIIVGFEYNTENDDLICTNQITSETNKITVDILMRSYVQLGVTIHNINRKTRYGIDTEEDNTRVVAEMKERMGDKNE